MLTVNIICVGKLKEKYLKDAVAEYEKRLSAFCKINIKELNEYKLPQNPSQSQITQCIKEEGDCILSHIKGYIVPLCIEGNMLSSEQLAENISTVALNGESTISFIIGGSYGLDNSVKSRADLKLSFSKMTFPHQLARVMLLEQIYRAFSINSNNKYHK
ncbi:MAG: 23S rRNA (pseudouridine(1915)-N(3))-methyltransferase RlmH [Oscillospiraceae bacterium]